MPPQGLRDTISGPLRSRSLLRSMLVLASLVLTIAAHPDTGPSPHSKNEREHGQGHGCLFALLANAREAILGCTPPSSSALLVARHASSNSNGSGSIGHGRAPRISGEALAAIILCSTIVFCAFLGCVLQLPAACLALHRRLFGSGRARDGEDNGDGAGGGGSGRLGLFDVEMGDEPASFVAEISPPPPYSRAPSYESSRSGGGAGAGACAGAGGRGGCTS